MAEFDDFQKYADDIGRYQVMKNFQELVTGSFILFSSISPAYLISHLGFLPDISKKQQK